VNNDELKATFDEWDRRVRQQSFEKGHTQGLEQGHRQGLEQGRKQGLKLGLRQGREEGLRLALVSLYQVRLGNMSEPLRAAFEVVDDENTLQRWVELFGTGSAEQIAAAVLGPKRMNDVRGPMSP
jgi:flagellar biosynthesis/type III secretory pathway protein FliH